MTHLADAAREAGIAFPFAGVAAISIGPITSQTLRELGWEPAAEANPSDIPGLIQAVATRARLAPPTPLTPRTPLVFYELHVLSFDRHSGSRLHSSHFGLRARHTWRP